MRFDTVGKVTTMNIKGEKWKLFVEHTDNDEVLRGDDGTPADGYCQMWDKNIIIRLTDEIDVYTDIGKEFRTENVLIHELVHAFAMESGIDKYAYDEKLITWIANIIPQVNRVVDEVKQTLNTK